MNYKEVLDFYKERKVLITGNTGFKGSWLTYILLSAGAEVTGYSLRPPTEPSLFSIIGLDGSGIYNEKLHQVYADVRDLEKMKSVFKESKPEIVFHLAAQPIVRDSYRNPVETYATNVMGTVNICECIRLSIMNSKEDIMYESGYKGVRSFLNVTTDKVYRNNEWEWGYRETDFLDGFDPYSNSKSCSELVTHSYRNAFFTPADGSEPLVKVSTARAGNVIGGGDFSNDRIIPDCIRGLTNAVPAGEQERIVTVRNPYSTRPYEHVLEPLFAYMLIVKEQYEDSKYAAYYNVGPDNQDCINTGNLVTLFCDSWNKGISGYRRNSNKKDVFSIVRWVNKAESDAPHEANFLKLDCSRLKSTFGWKPTWHIGEAIENVIEWTKVWLNEGDVLAEMDREIKKFIEDSSR